MKSQATMTVPFWKCVGGYTYCVFVSGRWHYVGDTWQEGQTMQKYFLGIGCRLERVQSIPPKIAKHFATLAILKNNLPKWSPR